MRRYGLLRTLRIKTKRGLGNMGHLASALGEAGASPGEITTLRLGYDATLRDYHLVVDDSVHLNRVITAINALPDSEVVEVVSKVHDVHSGGKWKTGSRVELDSLHNIQAALGPGINEVVETIDGDPSEAYELSAVGRNVAVVSDGTDIINIGKIESRAMLPILESRSAFLSEMAHLNAMPLALDIEHDEQFIDALQAIAPNFSAFLLTGQAAPRNLRLAQQLRERIPNVPVVDGSYDGAGISGLASFLRVRRQLGKEARTLKVGQIGLGTAGGSIARLIMACEGTSVFGDDVHPDAVRRHVLNGGIQSSLKEIMATCDVVFANTGNGGLIKPEMVREGQAILALSEPEPEIHPSDARAAGAAFAADGKAVTRAVVLPGLLVGSLLSRASIVNDNMRIAAAMAICDHTPEHELVAQPMDRLVHPQVALAVANAAIQSGVSQLKDPTQRTLDDVLEFMKA